MHAERKTHVVRMVVDHHHLETLRARHPFNQRQGQVMEVAATEEDRTVFPRQGFVEHAAKATKAACRTTEADRLLPFTQGQHDAADQRPDGIVEVKNDWLPHRWTPTGCPFRNDGRSGGAPPEARGCARTPHAA